MGPALSAMYIMINFSAIVVCHKTKWLLLLADAALLLPSSSSSLLLLLRILYLHSDCVKWHNSKYQPKPKTELDREETRPDINELLSCSTWSVHDLHTRFMFAFIFHRFYIIFSECFKNNPTEIYIYSLLCCSWHALSCGFHSKCTGIC